MDFSICIIMKNEEKNIGRCLDSIIENGFPADDVVLVDTGSTDGSIAEVEKRGIKTFYLEWPDDFSKAKNYAVSLAKHDAVLILDADEYIEKYDAAECEKAYRSHHGMIGQIIRHNPIEADGIKNIQTDRTERVFDRRSFHFIHPIHEQLVPISGSRIVYYNFPLEIGHSGYLISKEEAKAKAERNIRLLKKQLEDDPQDLYVIFQIGQAYLLMHDEASALPWFEKAMERVDTFDPSVEYMQMIVTGYGQCLGACGRDKDALALLALDDRFGNIPEYTYMMGSILMSNEKWGEACQMFVRCLSLKENRLKGATTYFPFHNLGVISEILGDIEIAKDFYRRAGNYPRSVERLKELEGSHT